MHSINLLLYLTLCLPLFSQSLRPGRDSSSSSRLFVGTLPIHTSRYDTVRGSLGYLPYLPHPQYLLRHQSVSIDYGTLCPPGTMSYRKNNNAPLRTLQNSNIGSHILYEGSTPTPAVTDSYGTYHSLFCTLVITHNTIPVPYHTQIMVLSALILDFTLQDFNLCLFTHPDCIVLPNSYQYYSRCAGTTPTPMVADRDGTYANYAPLKIIKKIRYNPLIVKVTEYLYASHSRIRPTLGLKKKSINKLFYSFNKFTLSLTSICIHQPFYLRKTKDKNNYVFYSANLILYFNRFIVNKQCKFLKLITFKTLRGAGGAFRKI